MLSMQRFFKDFESLDRFTLSLDCYDDTLQCPHCAKREQLVSHGVIYKQRSSRQREAVGKRVLCSNRYGRTGCGRTVQLYVAQVIPSLQYSTPQVFVFLSALLMNLTVKAAYQAATGQSEVRHAWRWLTKLERNLTDFRCFLDVRLAPFTIAVKERCRRLQLMLPTFERLFSTLPHCPCSHYQLECQRALI